MATQLAELVADVLVKRQTTLSPDFILESFDKIAKANIVTCTLTLFSVALRIYVRTKMLRTWGREDWAMVVCALLYCVHIAMSFTVCVVGRQYIGGNFALMHKFNKINSIGNGFFALTMVALKFSLGFFFLKLIGHKRPQRYTIYAVLALTSVTGGLYFGFATFTCAQVKDVGTLTGAFCPIQKTSTAIFAVFTVVNIIGDFVMTLIALFALIKAKLPVITKVIAGSLLALGCVGGIASIIRLAIVLQPVDLFGYVRQLFNSGLWLSIEVATGIIAANFAMTRPLLQLVLEKLHLVSTRGGSKTGTSGPNTFSRSHMHHTNRTTRTNRTERGEAGDDVLLDEIRKETVVVVTSEDEKSGVDRLHSIGPTRPRHI